MTEEIVTDALLRRFLLGDVNDEERRRIEWLYISDPAYRERTLMAEDDLIEDYLEGSLTPSEREIFLARYRRTPQQRRQVRIARSIRGYAVAQDAMPLPPGQPQETTSARSASRNFFGYLGAGKRRGFIAAVTVLIVGLVGAAIWLVIRTTRGPIENTRRVTIERELAELNAPLRLRETPPQLLSMRLPPVSIRSIGPPLILTPTTNAAVVELRLLWIQQEEYPSYQAVLRRVGGTEEFAILNLHVEANLDGRYVRVRLPTHLLTRGLYEVLLSAVTASGKPEQIEEYSFTVGD